MGYQGQNHIYVVVETTGHTQFMAQYLSLSIELGLQVFILNVYVIGIMPYLSNYPFFPAQKSSSIKNS